MTEAAPKNRNREEKETMQTKNKKNHQYSHRWVCLRLPTFKDGRTSFAIQKKLEHFPFTVKHDHLSINIQFTVQSFWVRNISTFMNYASRLNWPTCEMASTSTTSEPLAACCCWHLYRPILKTEPAPPCSTAKPAASEGKRHIYLHFWMTSYTFRCGVKLCWTLL